LEADHFSARDVIVEAVKGLRDDMRETRGVRKDQYLEVIDRLIRANEQFAKINKELGADQIQAFFIKFGLRDEAELGQRLELTRRGSESSPEEWLEDALAMLDFSLAQIPHKSQYALDRVKATTRKAGMLEPHLNGKESANGKDARPE